ncbi:MAG: hypothetical protein SGI98_11330 [Verrucomicrobiota bacterium]|nr:hypothetical protein [Verrucomicrobiota bacterium]
MNRSGENNLLYKKSAKVKPVRNNPWPDNGLNNNGIYIVLQT